jgi:hypothetical protein
VGARARLFDRRRARRAAARVQGPQRAREPAAVTMIQIALENEPQNLIAPSFVFVEIFLLFYVQICTHYTNKLLIITTFC